MLGAGRRVGTDGGCRALPAPTSRDAAPDDTGGTWCLRGCAHQLHLQAPAAPSASQCDTQPRGEAETISCNRIFVTVICFMLDAQGCFPNLLYCRHKSKGRP